MLHSRDGTLEYFQRSGGWILWLENFTFFFLKILRLQFCGEIHGVSNTSERWNKRDKSWIIAQDDLRRKCKLLVHALDFPLTRHEMNDILVLTLSSFLLFHSLPVFYVTQNIVTLRSLIRKLISKIKIRFHRVRAFSFSFKPRIFFNPVFLTPCVQWHEQ